MTAQGLIRSACVCAWVAAACTGMACSDSHATPVTPIAPSLVGSAAPSIELTGTAIGDDGRLVANAPLWVNFRKLGGGDSPGVAGMTDETGRYHVTFEPARGGYIGGTTAMVYLGAAGYEHEYRWLRPTTSDPHQVVDLHPRRIRQITAGESISVTVAPDDTTCINNVQDIPGLGGYYVCRTVRITVPQDGVLTVEAVSADPSTRHPPLAVETDPERDDCCLVGLSNPRTLTVTAGTLVIVNVEIVEGSPSQTFTLVTTIRN